MAAYVPVSYTHLLQNNDERKTLYMEFQQELSKDPAYTFIAYVDAVYAGRTNIKGITKDTVLGHHGVGIFYNIHEWKIEQ